MAVGLHLPLRKEEGRGNGISLHDVFLLLRTTSATTTIIATTHHTCSDAGSHIPPVMLPPFPPGPLVSAPLICTSKGVWGPSWAMRGRSAGSHLPCPPDRMREKERERAKERAKEHIRTNSITHIERIHTCNTRYELYTRDNHFHSFVHTASYNRSHSYSHSYRHSNRHSYHRSFLRTVGGDGDGVTNRVEYL